MGEEEWIVATQEGLGKLISKPKMTEKYLKKPPFRFLHDIIMEVSRTTTFGVGLYTTEECDAGSLGDKGAKVEFLNKAISCVCFALGEKIDVSANKIVAGLEADKTNFWLQKLHQAATTAVDKSEEAVARVHAGESVAAPRKKQSKPKDEEGGAAPPEDVGAAPDAGDEEARRAEEKRRRAEKKKREEEKRRAAPEEVPAAEEIHQELQPPPPVPSDGDAEEAERRSKKDEERRKKEEDKRRRDERKRQQAEEEERQRQAQEEALRQQQFEAEQAQQQAMYQQQEMMRQQEMLRQEDEQRRMMMMQQQPIPDDAGFGGDMPSAPGSSQAPSRPVADPGMQPGSDEIAARAEAMLQGGQPGAEESLDGARQRPERPRTAGRKPPKVTSKVTTRQDEPGLTQGVAPPTIIAEGAKDDDDEDMFEAPVQTGLPNAPVKADDNAPHGKLVRDLLAEKKAEEDKERVRKEEEDTREEVEEPGQKGIKMGRLKRKKEQATSAAEIDTAKLSESIQQLCQAANPLGKSIDLVHQDIANMGKELDHWKQEYREASEQYQHEQKMTEELLQPLYQKIAELDDRIAEQKTKIRNSRSRISKNDLKIQGLLESVVMAK